MPGLKTAFRRDQARASQYPEAPAVVIRHFHPDSNNQNAGPDLPDGQREDYFFRREIQTIFPPVPIFSSHFMFNFRPIRFKDCGPALPPDQLLIVSSGTLS